MTFHEFTMIAGPPVLLGTLAARTYLALRSGSSATIIWAWVATVMVTVGPFLTGISGFVFSVVGALAMLASVIPVVGDWRRAEARLRESEARLAQELAVRGSRR